MNDKVVWVLVVLVVLNVVVWYARRRHTSHMRREVIRHQHGRITGRSYEIKPWANSGWWIVSVIVLLVVLLLVVVS